MPLANHHDQTTEHRILEVARQAFFTKGYSGARMQDIADAAGINKALLHYYFRSKEKLFMMIFADAASTFIPQMHQILGSNDSLFKKIEVFVAEYLAVLSKNPVIPMFVLNELHKRPGSFLKQFYEGKKAPPVKKFYQQVTEEVRNGTLRPIEPVQLMIHLISLCIFPFVAKPLFQVVASLTDTQYKKMIEQRKTEVAAFIINSIKA